MKSSCLRNLTRKRARASHLKSLRKRKIGGLGLNGILIPLIAGVALGGCTTVRPSYDEKQSEAARIPGFEDVRLPLDGDLSSYARLGFLPRSSQSPVLISISGGGAGGAFSVGALEGWTAAGTRPSFDVVTGVSTGAFIAPFAFLGPQYDPLLRRLYTSGEAENLVKVKFLPFGIFGQSLFEQRPLRSMVDHYITPELLREIAVENKKGRRLFVLTTNLDTQEAIMWNMGAIASKGTPQALELFRDVLLASASIPGIFPAIKIDAVAGDKSIEELHSDGGSSSQFLTVPEAAFLAKRPLTVDRQRSKMYILINNALMSEFAMTRDKTFSVVARAYGIMVKSQTRNGLFAAYEFARLHKINFHVAAIDELVPYTASDPFNTDYMRAVYRIGYSNAVTGRLWRDAPRFGN
ncbi:alpha/beta hydrolase [Agrobacterium rhizogenes]|nr:patatin-like phospholipase family protein [Rhizobium rhizogenes]NTF89500.1 alpha/beta hydrolase [Rhizobium rhizogenes]